MSVLAVSPWLIVLMLVGVILFAAIAILVLRAARAKTPMVPASVAAATAPGAPAAPAPHMHDRGVAGALAVRRSFTEARRILGSWYRTSGDTSALPWILSVGEAGCGKTTMLTTLPLPRLTTLGTPASAESPDADTPLTWHLFEAGVVLDAAGDLFVNPTRPGADDRAWHALVGQLQRYRPERPLDAIVLSIPVTDFVGAARLSREALVAKAARIGDRLAELQTALMLRLPVYVVVTKCDTIPGFGELGQGLDKKRLNDMLGWSSPYSADSAFAPAWVDEAMDTLLRTVQETEFGVLAREDAAHDGDSLFLLPVHLGRARSPMRDFLQRMFQATTYERGAFLRGIYFTGDRDTTPPPEPAYVADLFSEKIFVEQGLAKPGARVFPSKNKVVRRLQLATLAIIFGGPFGLYAGVNGVRIGPWRVSRGVKAEAASITPLLRNIDGAVHEMRIRRDAFSNVSQMAPQEDMSVFRLLDDMASLSTNHMWSVFIPGSLLSPLHHDITDAIGLSFETIILPEFRARMVYRARRLTDASTRGVGREAAFGTNIRLPQYLSEMGALGVSIDRFNDLAQPDKGELQDLTSVVHYLYGEQVAPGFTENDGYYRRALAEAHASPILIDARTHDLAVRRAGELTRDAYQALLTRLSGSALDTDSLGDLGAARADVDAVMALRAFLDPNSPVEQALDSIHSPFAFGDRFVPSVRDTLAYYKGELTGRVLPAYADTRHTTDAALQALDALLKQPFMQAPAARAIDENLDAGMSLSWNVARLDDALAMKTAFDTFMARGLDPLPEALRNRVRRLATVQLGAAMTDIVAGSVHEDRALAVRSDDAHELADRITAFSQASARISQLLDVFDAIGATSTYDALLDLSSAHANALLARVDAAMDLGSRYRVSPSAVNSWNGRAPFSAVGFGMRPGALDDYLQAEATTIRTNAALAKPLITFLETYAGEAGNRAASLRTWDMVLADVDRFDRKPAGGSIAAIETMIRLEVDSIDVNGCARRAPRPASGGDIFAQRADAMWSAVWRRCVDVASREMVAAYGRLQTSFRTHAADRFPFAPADAPADASPADMAAVLHDYDALAAVAARTGPPDDPYGFLGARAGAFLADMAKVRVFLAAYMDSAAANRPPMFDYQIDFRVNRAHESGANQIADWTADIGDQHASLGSPVAARKGRWRAGDDVRFALRWATGSPVRPVDPTPAGARLTDDGIEFVAGGEWSLLRMLRANESDTPDPDGGATIKFAVRTARPTAPRETPAIARAYVRLRLFNPDTKAELTVPRFPVSAPPAGEDRR